MCSFFRVCFLLFNCDVMMAKSIQNVSDADDKDDTISKRMDTFELGLKNVSEKILQMSKEKEDERKRPMFFVRLSSSITLQTYSIVKFDTIVIDEGGNFNSGDGIYVAPGSGIYMFSWTIQEYTSKGAYTDLRVDNVIKGTLNFVLSSSESNDAATRTVFCEVQKGDHVWIQTRAQSSTNYFYNLYNSKCTFMGILMKNI